jgi:murein DD-endopeptidase MepM/ murein hydrolase activator NlpD
MVVFLLWVSESARGQIVSSMLNVSQSFDGITHYIDLNHSNALDITRFFWDTNTYNPYDNVTVVFPFQMTFSDSVYHSPILKKKVITSRYGWRWRRAHSGIDIDLITGDDVVSVLDGIVRFAKYNPGHGTLVVVRHFNGMETSYAHLSSIRVRANDTVIGGEILGRGGATGNARGSHLHFTMSYKGVAINPEYLFAIDESNKIRACEIWVTKKWTKPYFHSPRQTTKLELLSNQSEALASLKKEKTLYIVQSGDTLSHISRRNNISIRSICITNNIKSSSVLKVGQKLYLE